MYMLFDLMPVVSAFSSSKRMLTLLTYELHTEIVNTRDCSHSSSVTVHRASETSALTMLRSKYRFRKVFSIISNPVQR